ncbi:MAG: glycosyltransferase [Clostridia bacterium]
MVIDQYFSANNGMTISARRLGAKLSEHGNEVRIASTGKKEDTEYLMEKQYIPIFDKLVTSQGMTFAKPDEELLEKAIRWADIVHLLVPFALSRAAMEICQEFNVPYSAAFHCQPENVSSSLYLQNVKFVNDGIYWWFNRYIYQYCRHIHCPSTFIADELRNHGYEANLYVISNGIESCFRYRKIPKTEELQGRFVILSVGRLSVEKRQDVLIRAVAYSKHKKDIRIMLAGQGPRRKMLEQLSKELDVAVNINFYTKNQLMDLIAMSDLYVHASDAEIEAMSCMEAFAGGLVPIIADSKKSATPQFALDERSLFTAGDPLALAKKIDYWMEHEHERKEAEYRYSESAKAYDLDQCVYRVEEMFMQVINNSRGAENEQPEFGYAK